MVSELGAARMDNVSLALFCQVFSDLLQEVWEKVILEHARQDLFSEQIP